MQKYDRSSKWLIEHHGDAVLWLGGITRIAWWRALQAELVQTRRLPDGLREVLLIGEAEPDLFLVEIATRLETRLSSQLTDDILLCLLDRQLLPEVITIVLTPTGRKRTPSRRRLRSRRGLTSLTVGWHVVESWKLPAEDLLRANNVGLAPWIPLAEIPGPPEPVIELCRELADRHAPAEERMNLLAVTQILAGLRYNEADQPGLFEILGGEQIMIESPYLERFVNKRIAQARQQDVLTFLESRFGTVPDEIAAGLRAVTDESRLLELTRAAARCSDLESFGAELHK